MPDDQGRTMEAAGATGETEALRDALAASQERMLALLAQQEALASGISHDLRAPLRTIEAYAAILDREAGAALDATSRDHLARIRAAATRMGTLLEGLMDYWRVERGELAHVPVDLGLFADLALAELREADAQRPARANIASGLLALGDERLLRMLMTQLVRNAWAFSGDEVVLDVSGARQGDVLRVAVRDAGSGFDPAYAGRIFEPFHRLHLPEQGAGHGLGLAIAARIVARHGGRLRAESMPGNGSTFHVELPAAA